MFVRDGVEQIIALLGEAPSVAVRELDALAAAERARCSSRSGNRSAAAADGYGWVVVDRPGLDHVQIAAPPCSEDKARWFYGSLIGLPEVEKPEALRSRGGVWFGLAGAQLHIGIQDPFAPALKAHPALRFSAPELHALATRLRAGGVSVRWDQELPEVERFFVDDPWGNRLELLARRG